MTRGVLIAGACAFFVFGAGALMFPGIVALVDLPLPTSTAATDVRAVFGGVQLGVAGFLFWSSRSPTRQEAGAMAMALVFGSMVLGRLVGMGLDGEVTWLTLALTLAETTGLAAGLLLLKQTSIRS
jgi:hypothetical protein